MDGHKIFKNAAIPVILMIVGLCRYTQNLPLSIIAGIGIYAMASSIDRFIKRGDAMLRQDSTKRYNQLAVDLLKKILNRHYLPGSKLPSTRELAKQAGVNPNTMQRALQVLQDEKILIKQSTTGRYVTTDIQHLKNIRNRMLEQIKQNYQEEIRSYGSGFENDGTIGGK